MADPYVGEVVPLAKEYSGPVVDTSRPATFAPDVRGTRAKSDAAKRAADAIALRDPSVDYTREVEQFGIRAGFSRMSNDAERNNYLNRSVGEGNYGTDAYGRYFIKPEGLKKLGIQSDKPIPLDKSGASMYDVADYAGDAPSVIGGIGAAMAATGLGAIPGMAMAGLGAAGGKAIDEIVKRAQGLNLKGPLEQATSLAGEAAMGAAGEGVGRGVIGLGRLAMNPYGRFGDVPRQELTREALDAGMLPKVFQIQPRGKLLSRFQTMGESVLGDAAEKKNSAALVSGMDTLVGQAGNPSQNTGDMLVSGVKNYTENLADQSTSARLAANSELNKSLGEITRTLGSADPNVGTLVQNQIIAARKSFGDKASELYSKVDELVGGKPIVPTGAIKEQLQAFAKDLPTDKAGEKIFPTNELKQFFGKYGDLADMQTAAQMQQLRTDFRQASESANLVPGVDKFRARKLMESVNTAFDDAGKNLADPTVAEAIVKLRAADDFYKTGIRKFDAPSIAAITRDASRTGAVEPDRVVDYIIRPGHTSSVTRVKGLLSPEQWGKVSRSHFDSLIQDSTRVFDGAESVSGQSLLSNVSKMGKTLDAVYGNNAPLIRKYAQELAARDGKLDPTLLTGDLAANIQKALVKERELKTFLDKNYLSELGKTGQEAEQAAAFIFQPKSPKRIDQAKQFYGETSDAFKGLQNEAAKKLFSDFIKTGDDPLKQIFDGKAFSESLDKYGRSTLEATFGKQWTDDAYKFARIAQFVTQKNPNSGGLVSAMVALNPLRHIWKIADIAGTTYLLRQPGVLKWLSEGIQPGAVAGGAGALTRVGAIATALAKDKTSAGALDLTKMQEQKQ